MGRESRRAQPWGSETGTWRQPGLCGPRLALHEAVKPGVEDSIGAVEDGRVSWWWVSLLYQRAGW